MHYPPTPQRKACDCSDPCISTDDVYYAGPNLPNSGINTYNVLTSVIEKLDAIYAVPTLQRVTEMGNLTTLPIIADSFVKIGGDGTNLLLDNGTVLPIGDLPAGFTKTSELINDGEDGINPFITALDIPAFNPSDYDLDEFTNNNVDPFAHVSNLNSYVPYIGALNDVDLGTKSLSATATNGSHTKLDFESLEFRTSTGLFSTILNGGVGYFRFPVKTRDVFTIATTADLPLPKYKVYTALLTQTGTDAPVATVLENTLGGEIYWSRNSAGNYIGTLNDAFPEGKTVCFYTHDGYNGATGYGGLVRNTSDTIWLTFNNYIAQYIDTEGQSDSIEIRVYS